MRRLEPRERRLELERFLTASCTNALMIFSPHGPSAPRPNPPQKPRMPAKPTPRNLPRVAVEHVHADVAEDLHDLVLLSDSKSWLPSTATTGIFTGARSLREHPRLLGESVVGEVAAEHEHVGRLGDLR